MTAFKMIHLVIQSGKEKYPGFFPRRTAECLREASGIRVSVHSVPRLDAITIHPDSLVILSGNFTPGRRVPGCRYAGINRPVIFNLNQRLRSSDLSFICCRNMLIFS